MYKIICDGEILHDPSLDNPKRLVFGARISQQVNMADSLEFTIYPSNPGAASIHKLASTIEVYADGTRLFRGRPIQSKTGWENQITYTCEGGLAMLNDTILRPYSFNGSVREYLEMLLLQHNAQVPAAKQFSLGTVTVTDPNNYIVRSNEEYVTTMAEIQEKLIGNLGGYLVPTYTGTGWRMDYLADTNETTSQKITLAKNLLDFLREQNAENIATALIPLGAVDDETGERITIASVNSGLDYIVDQTAAAQYGLIFATQTWDDVTVPANLLTKAQARLTDYATLLPTIRLTAVDLSLTDQAIEPIRLLDKVTVEDDQHAASGQYVVMERTYNLSAPENDSVTFGGTQPTISAASAKTAADVHDIPAKVLTTASERARTILDDATDGAIQILYNQDGVAYELRINNSQNPSTATGWWRYNNGGWGYYDEATGTYKAAATMDGALLANIITAGILKSDDGTTFYLDLDNGILKGNFTELKISASPVATQNYADGAAEDAVDDYDTALDQQAVFNKLTDGLANQGIYIDPTTHRLYINASMIKSGTIDSVNIDVTGTNADDGRVLVKYSVTQSGNTTTYKSILKPAMLVNSYDLTSSGGGTSHAEADLRYDRLTFVDGTTEQSSYEDTGAYIKNGNNELQVLPTGLTGKVSGSTKFSFSNILLSLLNNTIKLNSDGLAFYADPNFPNDPTAIYPPNGLINYTEDVNPPTGVTERFTMRFVTSKYGAYIDYFQISFIRFKFSSGQTSQGGGYATSSYGSAGNWNQAFTHLTGAFAFCLNLAGTAFHYGTQANKNQGGEYKVFSPTLISSGAIDWDIVVVGFGQYSNYA